MTSSQHSSLVDYLAQEINFKTWSISMHSKNSRTIYSTGFKQTDLQRQKQKNNFSLSKRKMVKILNLALNIVIWRENCVITKNHWSTRKQFSNSIALVSKDYWNSDQNVTGPILSKNIKIDQKCQNDTVQTLISYFENCSDILWVKIV